MTVSVSILLGVALGAANAVAALVLYSRARGRDPRAFMTLVLGGMMVRMALLLAAVAAVIGFGLAAPAPFVAALGGSFVAGLAAEIAYLMLRPAGSGASARPAASPAAPPR